MPVRRSSNARRQANAPISHALRMQSISHSDLISRQPQTIGPEFHQLRFRQLLFQQLEIDYGNAEPGFASELESDLCCIQPSFLQDARDAPIDARLLGKRHLRINAAIGYPRREGLFVESSKHVRARPSDQRGLPLERQDKDRGTRAHPGSDLVPREIRVVHGVRDNEPVHTALAHE